MDSTEPFIHWINFCHSSHFTELLLRTLKHTITFSSLSVFIFISADSLSPPVNVTIREVKANSAVVSWDIPEGDPVIGFAITQQVGNTLCPLYTTVTINANYCAYKQ